MAIELSSVAQVIVAISFGTAAVLKALAVFLPAWRAGKRSSEIQVQATPVAIEATKVQDDELPRLPFLDSH